MWLMRSHLCQFESLAGRVLAVLLVLIHHAADACGVSRESLFSDAETSEQGVEHLLNPGAAGDAVERARGESQAFGEQDQVARLARGRRAGQPVGRADRKSVV